MTVPLSRFEHASSRPSADMSIRLFEEPAEEMEAQVSTNKAQSKAVRERERQGDQEKGKRENKDLRRTLPAIVKKGTGAVFRDHQPTDDDQFKDRSTSNLLCL